MLIKLEWLGYCVVKKLYVKPFSYNIESHDRTDGPTDRETDLLYQYRASVCWRAIKSGFLKASWKCLSYVVNVGRQCVPRGRISLWECALSELGLAVDHLEVFLSYIRLHCLDGVLQPMRNSLQLRTRDGHGSGPPTGRVGSSLVTKSSTWSGPVSKKSNKYAIYTQETDYSSTIIPKKL